MRRLIVGLTLALVALCHSDPAYAVPPCQLAKSQPRKEIRNLTEAEWTKFAGAVRALKNEMKNTPADGPVSTYDLLAKLGDDNAKIRHGNASFLPWHRRYLREFERHLQRVANDSSIMIPYWDSSFDSQSPALSSVFGPKRMGKDGMPIPNGSFAFWRARYPALHYVSRRFDRTMSLLSAEQINRIVSTAKTYDEFRRSIESLQYGATRKFIGGDMAQYEANDPIYWTIAANVDRLWARWQASNPRLNSSAYGGKNADGSRASLDDVMTPWPKTVRQLLSTESLTYCYQPFSK